MQTEVIVAIIGAGAAIVVAMLELVQKKKGKPKDGSKADGDPNSIINVSGDTIQAENISIGGNITDKRQILIQEKEEADLQIVDTDFVEDDGYFMDIKLRNSGDKVAFIHKIEFRIQDHYTLKRPPDHSYYLGSPSATYDIVLDNRGRQLFPLSQVVEGNSIDRFRLRIGNRLCSAHMATVFRFFYVLYYNEDQKKAESEEFVAVFPSHHADTNSGIPFLARVATADNLPEVRRFYDCSCKKSGTFERLYHDMLAIEESAEE